MNGLSPQSFIPSHKVIGPLGLEKKIFEGLLPYMGVAAILGHVTQTPQTNVRSPIPLRHNMEIGW